MTQKIPANAGIPTSGGTGDSFSLGRAMSYLSTALVNWITVAANRINLTLPEDGSERMTAPLPLAEYTTASLPTASSWTGSIAFTSDSKQFHWSDGTIWEPVGSGSGSVTSVGLSLPVQFSVVGSPLISTGTITASWINETSGTVFAGPVSGSSASPTFRALAGTDLPAAVGPTIFPNTTVIICPRPGQTLAEPWLVFNPDGSAVSTVGSTTQGLQEAINAAVLNGYVLRGMGQTINSGGTEPVYINTTSTIAFPPMQDADIDLGSIALNIVNNTAGIKFDSVGNSRIELPGKIVYTGNGIAVWFAMIHPTPNDGIVGIYSSEFKFGAIAVIGGTNPVGIEITLSNGGFNDNKLEAREINGTSNGTFGFYVNSVAPSSSFEQNLIVIQQVHLWNSAGVQLGPNTTNQSNLRQNTWLLGGIQPAATGSIGFSSFGSYDFIFGASATNEEGILTDSFVFNSGSTGNVLIGSSIGAANELINNGSGNQICINGVWLAGSAPPSGVAGGDLTGSYPNPTLLSTTFTATVGTYQGITVNSKGLVTSAINESYLTGNQAITLSGDVSGSGTTAITATLPAVNANVGTFQGLTVNAKGQVTSASNQSYGSVLSVGMVFPTIFSVAGSPITVSGTITASLISQTSGTVFAGPTSGSSASPTFRALVGADLPAITSEVVNDTYNLATASGLQNITFNFTPSACIGFGTVDGETGLAYTVYNAVSDSSGSNSCMYAGAGSLDVNTTTFFIVQDITGANYQIATLSYGTNKVVLNWTKTGAPTGTFSFIIKGLK